MGLTLNRERVRQRQRSGWLRNLSDWSDEYFMHWARLEFNPGTQPDTNVPNLLSFGVVEYNKIYFWRPCVLNLEPAVFSWTEKSIGLCSRLSCAVYVSIMNNGWIDDRNSRRTVSICFNFFITYRVNQPAKQVGPSVRQCFTKPPSLGFNTKLRIKSSLVKIRLIFFANNLFKYLKSEFTQRWVFWIVLLLED